MIYPSALSGTLAERKSIVPLPASYFDNRELNWSDTFELEQLVETAWAKTPHAVPFGSPVFVCYYRADMLKHLNKRPPQTWTEYHELAVLAARREELGDLCASGRRGVVWHRRAVGAWLGGSLAVGPRGVVRQASR